MKLTRMRAMALGIAFLASSATVVSAQDAAGGADNAAQTQAAGTDNDGFDLGWLGLIGLAGLAGLAGRRRDPRVVTPTHAGTTTVR